MKYQGRLVFAGLLFAPAAASAHPGDHSFVSGMIGAGQHLLSQPDHALAMLAAAGLAMLLYRRLRRAKA